MALQCKGLQAISMCYVQVDERLNALVISRNEHASLAAAATTAAELRVVRLEIHRLKCHLAAIKSTLDALVCLCFLMQQNFRFIEFGPGNMMVCFALVLRPRPSCFLN